MRSSHSDYSEKQAALRTRSRALRFAILLIIGLTLSALGCEWTWGLTSPYLFNAVTRLSPLPVAVVAGLYFGAVGGARRGDRILRAFLVLNWLLAMVIVAGYLTAEESSRDLRPEFYVTLAQTPVFALLGYAFARGGGAVSGTFSGIARVLAVIGAYAALVPVVAIGETFPTHGVGFPVALLVLFGFNWYLFQWISARGIAARSLAGLLACSGYVLARFHKPMVFSALASILVVVALAARVRGIGRAARVGYLLAGAVSAFVAANAVTGGSLADRYEKEFYERYLHAEQGDIPSTSDELLRRASAKRFDLWELGLTRFTESPWLGSGFGQRVTIDSGANVNVHIHNGYIDWLQSVGILGTLPVVVGLSWWIASILEAIARGKGREWSVPLLGYVCGLMAYNAVGVVTSFHTVTSLAALLVGLSVGEWTRARMAERSG